MERTCWNISHADGEARERASGLEPFLGSKNVDPVGRVRPPGGDTIKDASRLQPLLKRKGNSMTQCAELGCRK